MKNRTYNLTTVFLLITLFFSNCSVDDYKVQGELTEETFIESKASAESVLNGIYESARPNNDRGIIQTVLGTMVAGLEQKTGIEPQVGDLTSFYTNNVKPKEIDDRTGLFRFYKGQYGTINLANIFISTIEKKGINGTSKEDQNEMLAQAKALRAHAYFMLLRVFGQFYNNSSEYGIPTTEKFIDAFTYLKRAKVSETYDQIIKDLKYALQYTSDNKDRVYITNTYVKALLAKVYLYRGGVDNWSKTVVYCKDILDNLGNKFKLADTYSSIYQESFKSSEVIFAPFYSNEESVQGGNIMSSENVTPSDYFQNLASEMVKQVDENDIPKEKTEDESTTKYDPRYEFTFGKDSTYTGLAYKKYPNNRSTFYFLRVAEIYLIYAEALVRTDGDMQVALDALNTVRKRAYNSEGGDSNGDDDDLGDDDLGGFDKPGKALSKAILKEYTYTDKATLLENIRKEKMLELHLETGETWFDLVRYDRLGDLEIVNLKPTITSVDKLIFPIPLRVISNNPNFGHQNPGY